MGNLITRTTELAMAITRTYINVGDTVADATCGTGQDTVALARAAGPQGKVLAFDIQEKALAMTGERLHENGILSVQLINDSFVFLEKYLPANSAAAVVFNLGYLPGGDHSITTTAEDTLIGLRSALRTIRPGGIVTVVLYDGHASGVDEKKRVIEWAENLDPVHYHAAFVNLLNQKKHPPEILWITKKR